MLFGLVKFKVIKCAGSNSSWNVKLVNKQTMSTKSWD